MCNIPIINFNELRAGSFIYICFDNIGNYVVYPEFVPSLGSIFAQTAVDFGKSVNSHIQPKFAEEMIQAKKQMVNTVENAN